MKNIFFVFLSLGAAVLITLFQPYGHMSFSAREMEPGAMASGHFRQAVTLIHSSPVTVTKLYENGSLLAVVSDEAMLDNHLKEVYKNKYEKDFPSSKVYLSKELYLTKEKSYCSYEDIDEEIISYLDENNMYSVLATAVSLSNDEGEYARFFVSNEEVYQRAFREYVCLFISEESLDTLQNGESVPELTTYGTRDMGISIAQKVSLSEDYASPEDIKTTVDEVVDYLAYSGKEEREYYTVKMYDTVAGVGARTKGLTAAQIMAINYRKIKSIDQVLKEGEELCITYFSPMIDVVVYKEALRSETVYYGTVVVEDATMFKGEQETRVEGSNGSRNVLYSEKWNNGILLQGVEKSSIETIHPTDEVIAVGSMEYPDVGTGSFRFPVDNPNISCPWGCYYGHRGTDITNRYEPWGKVFAADRGVIKENSFNYISGNYVIIDHNNGYESYYGHMRVPSPLPVGTVVDKGEVIGDIGMTGRANGPHVHFFINEFGERRDACSGFLDCDSLR